MDCSPARRVGGVGRDLRPVAVALAHDASELLGRLHVDRSVGRDDAQLAGLGAHVGVTRVAGGLSRQLLAPVLAGQLGLLRAPHEDVPVVGAVLDVEAVVEVPAAGVDHLRLAQLLEELQTDGRRPDHREGLDRLGDLLRLAAQARHVGRPVVALALERLDLDLAPVELELGVDEVLGGLEEHPLVRPRLRQAQGPEHARDRRVLLRLVPDDLHLGRGDAGVGRTGVLARELRDARRGGGQLAELPPVDAMALVAFCRDAAFLGRFVLRLVEAVHRGGRRRRLGGGDGDDEDLGHDEDQERCVATHQPHSAASRRPTATCPAGGRASTGRVHTCFCTGRERYLARSGRRRAGARKNERRRTRRARAARARPVLVESRDGVSATGKQ